MASDLSSKIRIDVQLRAALLSRFGITFEELKECITNGAAASASDSEFGLNAESSIHSNVASETTRVLRTNRGRTIEITFALSSTRLHEIKLPDKVVSMREDGNFLEILDAKPVFPVEEAVNSTEEVNSTEAVRSIKPVRSTEAKTLNSLNWGDFRRLKPVYSDFGFDVGQPIDRYYIEQFLNKHRKDIRGHVLEIGDDVYTKQFGTSISSSTVLHVSGNEKSTLVGNLETGEGIPRNTYDCIILTQTLPFVFDVNATLLNCREALKSGGTLLATVNGISQISRYDMDKWGDFWRFTNLSLEKLLMQAFPSQKNLVDCYGNFLSAIAFLAGLPAQSLTISELNFSDQNYQVLLGGRVEKSANVF